MAEKKEFAQVQQGTLQGSVEAKKDVNQSQTGEPQGKLSSSPGVGSKKRVTWSETTSGDKEISLSQTPASTPENGNVSKTKQNGLQTNLPTSTGNQSLTQTPVVKEVKGENSTPRDNSGSSASAPNRGEGKEGAEKAKVQGEKAASQSNGTPVVPDKKGRTQGEGNGAKSKVQDKAESSQGKEKGPVIDKSKESEAKPQVSNKNETNQNLSVKEKPEAKVNVAKPPVPDRPAIEKSKESEMKVSNKNEGNQNSSAKEKPEAKMNGAKPPVLDKKDTTPSKPKASNAPPKAANAKPSGPQPVLYDETDESDSPLPLPLKADSALDILEIVVMSALLLFLPLLFLEFHPAFAAAIAILCVIPFLQ